ncbi:DNA polymerase III subunit beta [Shouchella lonarensis]|uniref:Beta sliding clamp n=1 Tax=Shouchella lonarensis TaxID=1464122 RepID=A0A1G6NNF6_9BACI|nr:DNA polymerase III subunit beta [Shouchella lonarensis]SDC68904.1 DNA polymerase III, beta subunit [Shouchella lonarensis]
MHILVNSHRMIQEVQHVVKAVSSRTTIPILSGIKLDVSAAGLTLIGSDANISIESFIPTVENEQEIVTIHQTGAIVLPAKYLAEIVKKLPGEEMDIHVQQPFSVTIQSGASIFTLNGFDPEEYPRLPVVQNDAQFSLPQQVFKNVIRQTAFAVSTQETRPVLTGVHLCIVGKKLTCTATDSHRLALRTVEVDLNENDGNVNNVVIPGRSLQELNKILEDVSDDVEIVVTDNQILFKVGNLLFFSRLLEGKYPVTTEMIPAKAQAKTTFELKTKSLLQTLERALLLSREGKNNVVHLKVIDQTQIELTSTSQEIGKVTEQLHVEKLQGEHMHISFNGKNVIDALRVVDSENIYMMFTGTMNAFLVRPSESDHTIHLFSPVRTY